LPTRATASSSPSSSAASSSGKLRLSEAAALHKHSELARQVNGGATGASPIPGRHWEQPDCTETNALLSTCLRRLEKRQATATPGPIPGAKQEQSKQIIRKMPIRFRFLRMRRRFWTAERLKQWILLKN